MAEVSIEIAGRSYPVTCRDGEESKLRAIASLVDVKAKDIQRSMGGVNETRQLLLAALLLADELNDLRMNDRPLPLAPPAPSINADLAPILEKLASRVETLAEKLETAAPNA